MKSKETTEKIVKGGRIYQTAEEIRDSKNGSFKCVFNMDEDFTEPNMPGAHWVLTSNYGTKTGN